MAGPKRGEGARDAATSHDPERLPLLAEIAEDDDDESGEAPETPTDEPLPIPIQDPPSEASPSPPMTV